jgi:hypothetical protein
MIRTMFAGALLAALGGAFATGSANAGPKNPPTPPNPGCHASMPPELCNIIRKRDKKGPPQASTQNAPGHLATRRR